MKAFTEKLVHILTLLGVTAIAIWVMWMMNSKNNPAGKQQRPLRPLADVARPKAPVLVLPMEVQPHEILATFSGKIRPWETHHVSFEVAGRVQELGSASPRDNLKGEPLDEGDTVEAGQVLAHLDDRVFRALKSEASAQLEQASSDLQRAQRLRATNPTALTDSELQGYATKMALARAQLEVAMKNLEDATLISPVRATISRRFINPGESVGANQQAFELVENEEVLLVVEVPESQVRELENRLREVRAKRTSAAANGSSEDTLFRAYVELKGRDRLGNPWPALKGEVYRISEVADPRTSLFQVEIRLPNSKKLLRSGMIATAHIVLARIPAYELPEMAVLFRGRRAFLFSVEEQPAEMEMMYWNVGPTEMYRAKRIDLTTWIEQDQKILIPVPPASRLNPMGLIGQRKLQWVVVRGQHRLADSQLVRIMNPPAPSVATTDGKGIRPPIPLKAAGKRLEIH